MGPDVAFCTVCGYARDRGGSPESTEPHEDRRRVSVLFIDLIDSTPYTEHTDPELVRSMQQTFFREARRVIDQYGGVVEKYIGDAVMALFGAPVSNENDPLRCVRAGLELQRVLARFEPESSWAMRFRVGIATGEAIVDLNAARDRGQAFAAGDVVNTASRLQVVAPPGGVLVCGPTHSATRSTIRYAEQPPILLRGRSAPTEVWLALAPVQRQQPDRESEKTPLVGREHELSVLVNALRRSIDDRMPQLVTVFGQAGIGKSRLVRELFQQTNIPGQPITWRTGRCPPFGENVVFSALADIVKAEAGILDTDPADTAAERLAATLRKLFSGSEVSRLADALSPLVGLPSRASPSLAQQAEEPESAWRRFLVGLAARQPTVLVFEDVHWADGPMRRFIELLGASARDVPLLLLCTARPELVDRDPTWAGTITGSLTITLKPLRNHAIAALLTHMLRQAAFPAELVTPLVELADGNPLYAHEYVRMLIDRGEQRPSGLGSLLEQQHELPMPDSVHAVIANRVDLLYPNDRMVLQAAAVVGMVFWPGAVAAALSWPVESVERLLRRLEQRDFVHEQPDSTMAGQSEYRFRHVLVRDVCYQRLPRTERVARHERTADWLDAIAQDRDTDLVEVLAHHRWAAHEIVRTLGMGADRYAASAIASLRRAARRAYALRALDTAATHVGRALALFRDDQGDALERLRLELFATELSFYRDGPTFLDSGGSDQLIALADRLYAHGDQGFAARAWTLIGQVAWLGADRTAALSCLDRAVELFDALPDSAEKADAYAELGRLHMLNYERDPAVAAAGAAAEIAERLGLAEAQAQARITVATSHYQAGDPHGLDDLYAAVDMCRTQRLFALGRATRNLGFALWEEGDSVRSNDLLDEAQQVEGGPGLATGYSDETMLAYLEGDFDRLLSAADPFVDTPGGRWDMQVRGLRSVVRVLRGDPDDDVADALAIARSGAFHRPLWTALSLGALCRALTGRTGETRALLAELAADWRTVPALASGEWIGAAAYAGALAGREAAEIVHSMLTDAPRRTPWSDTALLTAAGALATADGDHGKAAESHGEVAAAYAKMPNETYRVMSLAFQAAALARAGRTTEAAEVGAEVAQFATANRAPGLLDIAEAR